MTNKLERFDVKVLRDGPFDDFLQDLNAVGVNCSTVGERYRVFGARSNSRWWLIPSDHGGSVARASLDMFQPITSRSKFLKFCMLLVTYIFPSFIWGGSRIRFEGQPKLLECFHFSTPVVAYFTGTAGPHRKTAIKVMSSCGDVLGYAKLTRNPLVSKWILNEARVLESISGLDIKAAYVPKVLSVYSNARVSYLVTDGWNGCVSNLSVSDVDILHVNFFQEIISKTKSAAFDRLVIRISSFLGKTNNWLSIKWVERFEKGVKIIQRCGEELPTCLAHGDFTPWNCFSVGDKLYVFDWEYSYDQAPIGYDLIHFLLSTRLDQPAEPLISMLKAKLVETRIYDGEYASELILTSLLLHSAFYFDRVFEAGEPCSEWKESVFRSPMIDVLLGDLT